MCLAGLQLNTPDAEADSGDSRSTQPEGAAEVSAADSGLQEDPADQSGPDCLSSMLTYMAQVSLADLEDHDPEVNVALINA